MRNVKIMLDQCIVEMMVSWGISGSRGNGHEETSPSDSVVTGWMSSYLDSRILIL